MEPDTLQFENTNEDSPTAVDSNDAATDTGAAVVDHIFTPGSTLNPTFLLITDLAFVALLVVLLLMLFATRSIHFFALTAIELALWVTVKWFVTEWKAALEEEARAKEEASANGTSPPHPDETKKDK